MKRIGTIALAVIAFFGMAQASSYTTPDRNITVYKTPKAPVIDAVEDSAWVHVQAFAVTQPDSSAPASPIESSTDYAGWFKVMWDDGNVYFFFNVVDDLLYTDDTGDNDKVELFFDADASGGITQAEYEADYATDFGAWGGWWIPQHTGHTMTYDQNCSQWVMEVDGTALSTGTQGPGLSWTGTRFPLDGIQSAVKITEDEAGYTMEFAIPWASLLANTPMKAGDKVGFNVQINDFDLPSARGFYNWVMDFPNANWCDPTVFGKMTLSGDAPGEEFTMPVAKAGVVPVIDGLQDAVWQYTMPRAIVNADVNTTYWPLQGSTDYLATFRALWDADNLYFFFEIMDDMLIVDETGDNDKLEFFFDADASGGITQADYEAMYTDVFGAWGGWWIPQHTDHTMTYDENCSQWTLEAETDVTTLGTGTQGPGLSWTGTRFPLDGIKAAVHMNEDDAGYTMEAAIPWESLLANTPMKTGDLVGMNLQANDFDLPGERAFYDWRNIWANASWCDPNNFGQMVLAAMTVMGQGPSGPLTGMIETFTDPIDTSLYHPNKGTLADGTPMFAVTQDNGALKIVMNQASFPDGQFYDFGLIGTQFDLTQNPIVSMKIKLASGAKWGTAAASTVPFSLSPWNLTAANSGVREHSNITFNVPADDAWHTYTFDWSTPDADQATYPNDYSSITAFLLETVKWPSAHQATFWIDDFSIGDQVTGVEDRPAMMLNDFVLSQNYPNPFNPTTRIDYTVKQRGQVRLSVYSVRGVKVATLVNEIKPAGNYQMIFDASGLSSGIYFYKLEAGGQVITKKMSLLR
jgi:hypothetical protein